jgi:hypothetical protein
MFLDYATTPVYWRTMAGLKPAKKKKKRKCFIDAPPFQVLVIVHFQSKHMDQNPAQPPVVAIPKT